MSADCGLHGGDEASDLRHRRRMPVLEVADQLVGARQLLAARQRDADLDVGRSPPQLRQSTPAVDVGVEEVPGAAQRERREDHGAPGKAKRQPR
jgi:hypothetical protein